MEDVKSWRFYDEKERLVAQECVPLRLQVFDKAQQFFVGGREFRIPLEEFFILR